MGLFKNSMREVREASRSRLTDHGVAELRVALEQFRTESGHSLKDLADTLEQAAEKAREVLSTLEAQVEKDRVQIAEIITVLRSLLVSGVVNAESQERMEAATAVVAEDLLAAHERAEAVGGADPGAAADAAARREDE